MAGQVPPPGASDRLDSEGSLVLVLYLTLVDRKETAARSGPSNFGISGDGRALQKASYFTRQNSAERLRVMVEFSHLDSDGKARMVDVSDKAPSQRVAVARGKVKMRPETVALIEGGDIPKGDVLGVAKVAGIMAAKRTSDLIPMCHPLEITGVEIRFESRPDRGEIEIEATAKTCGRTGVEMEALTAVAIAALTIYDMCKSADRDMVLSEIRLVRKEGGKSGRYVRQEGERG